MTKVTLDDVKKLAKLSAIRLNDEQVEKMTKELQAILEYFEQLQAVDTRGVEPTYQVTGKTNVYREDEIMDYGVDRDSLLSNAPEAAKGQIKVRRVL